MPKSRGAPERSFWACTVVPGCYCRGHSQGDVEMAFRAIRVALLFAGLPIAGCGTVANLANQPPGGGGMIPFGGVRHDVAAIHKASNGEPGPLTHPDSDLE